MTKRERDKVLRAVGRELYERNGPAETYPWDRAGKGVRDFWIATAVFVLDRAAERGVAGTVHGGCPRVGSY